MLLNGKLNTHLEEIDRQAEVMFSQLVEQFCDAEGVTEGRKAQNQMLWVQRMNNIRSRAAKIVCAELIYAAVTYPGDIIIVKGGNALA